MKVRLFLSQVICALATSIKAQIFLPAFCISILVLARLPSLPSLAKYYLVALLSSYLVVIFVKTKISAPTILHMTISSSASLSGRLNQFFHRIINRGISPCLPILASTICGWLCAWLWAIGWGINQVETKLPSEWEGQDIIIEGVIEGIPRDQGRRMSFILNPTEILEAPKSAAAVSNIQKLRLSWYDKPEEIVLQPGQKWRFEIRLRRPFSFMNPGGFDYEAWIIRNNIKASGYIRKDFALLDESHPSLLTQPLSWIDKQRWNVYNKLISSDIAAKGLIIALMLGERSLIEPEENLVIRRSGLAHLLAISGLHLSIVAGGIFVTLFLFFSTMLRFNLMHINPLRAAAWLSLVVVWFYAFWTGFSLPVQRAAIMFSFFLMAIILKSFFIPWRVYFMAMAAILLIDPLAGTSGGFYLSFAAVALIIICVQNLIPVLKPALLQQPESVRIKVLSYVYDLVVIQLILTIGLIPLTLLFFNEFSLIGVGINLIAVPLASFIIMPWVVLSNLYLLIAGGSNFLVDSLGDLIAWCYDGLASLQASSASSLVLSLPKTSSFALVSVLAALIILVWGIRPHKYLLFMLLLLPSIFSHPATNLRQGEILVNFLDVGQGLAVHLQTKNKHLIYDTGASFASGTDIGQLVLVPYLRTMGVNQIDRLVVSHKDGDHSGGMRGLMEQLKVDRLMANFAEDFLRDYDGQIIAPAKTEPCIAGKEWKWDGVSFRIVHPEADQRYQKSNDRSCVLLVTTGDKSLLLTGDITSRVEHHFELPSEISQVSLLQVPHHGSKSSSSVKWLDRTSPQNAIFSAGYRNPYKHPAAEVVAKYESIGAKTWMSWQEGRISFLLSPDSIEHLDSYRRSKRRYWHHKPGS